MKKDIDKRQEFVEKALQRLEKDRYQANPYLYTRVKQQLREQQSQASTNRRQVFYWKPALAAVMILLNVFVYYNMKSSLNQMREVNQLKAFANDYAWNDPATAGFNYLTTESDRDEQE